MKFIHVLFFVLVSVMTVLFQCGCIENVDTTKANNNSIIQETSQINNATDKQPTVSTKVEYPDTNTSFSETNTTQPEYQDLEWISSVNKQYAVTCDDWKRILSNTNDVRVGEKEDYKTLSLDAKIAKEESASFNVSSKYTEVKNDWEKLLGQYEHFGNVVTGSRTQQARELVYDIGKQQEKTDNELSELGIIVFKSTD